MELRPLIQELEKRNLLLKIKKEVSTKYEISTIIKMLEGNPVLFENVQGHNMPIVANICATKDLVALGLGIERKQMIPELTKAIASPKFPEISQKEYEAIGPYLSKLPILTYYPQDGGPYIASGIAFAHDSMHGTNASYHRAMVIDDTHLVFRILERHLHEFMQRGLKKFAFCIGSSTSVLVSSALSVKLGKSELAIANALNGAEVVDLEDHLIPASEIVILCEFTGEQADEGPFLDLTESFDIVRKQPVAKVQQIYVRKNPIFHALLPGDKEHKILMGMPREATIYLEVEKVCPCKNVLITPGGCSWLHAAVQIKKQNPDDGKKAIEAAFKGHASMKHVFIVDEDIDIEDPNAIEWAMATRFQGHKDLIIKTKQKGSSLDPSSDLANRETTKVGFDLTIPTENKDVDFRKPELPMKINLADYLE